MTGAGILTGRRIRQRGLMLAIMGVGLLLFMLGSIFIGRYSLSPSVVSRILLAEVFPIEVTWPPAAETILFDIRLPRVLVAACVGASLGISGAAFQGMLRNPLVSPEILGVSAGAGFGAVLMILMAGNPLTIQAASFVFGLVAVTMSYRLARMFTSTGPVTLILAGIVVGSIFGSLISLLTHAAEPFRELPAIVFWLLGSLSAVTRQDMVLSGALMLAGVLGLLLLRWRINVLSFGEEEARSLGIDIRRERAAVVLCCTLATASAVAVSGIVAWVGLLVPHLARLLTGADHRTLLPASAMLGAFYLLLVDNIARAATGIEIPLGILTGLVGAPFFALLLKRSSVVWR